MKQDKFYSDEAAVHLLSDGKFAAKLYAVVFKYGHVFLLMEKLCKKSCCIYNYLQWTIYIVL